ncbi:Uridine kinase [Rasamsonia emersonii CBS 393.64]|uniref:Uridine kinase n=1 Tax=Rasamsonia emersonii (strain ATCC 16479 / CBS 393.64 / IMI 116815) TaxID=1408163 RepID=A0A0F4YSJ8_RASE3|nr:Uridine kinase [Rasamsonia emersonii CBS 393.64]KKA21085.1 Uridine kinase [Rasamsonia emersonii CBS 393.64]
MSTERKVYFVFGGPGAGKGTLCTRLAQEMGLAHVCVGDLLRAAIERSDEFEAREQVQRAMKEGKLAPVGAIRTVLEKALQTQSVVLLDGFPRSLEQMSMFEEFFGNDGASRAKAPSDVWMLIGQFDCEGDLDEIYEGIKNQFQALLNKVKTDRE